MTNETTKALLMILLIGSLVAETYVLVAWELSDASNPRSNSGSLVSNRTSGSRIAACYPNAGRSDDEGLEICVMDYDGIVVALLYPCHKSGAGWVECFK